MAVPTGEYEAKLRVDLAPFFGVVAGRVPVRLEQPGPDALDRVVARLRSEDLFERHDAVDELSCFLSDGDRVAPILVALLEDPELRQGALYSLSSFPEHAARHVRTILKLALRGERWLRIAALDLLGETAPDADIVRKVVGVAARVEDERLAWSARNALDRIRERAAGD